MSNCRDCEQKIVWAEIWSAKSNVWKKIPIDPMPTDDGELILIPTNPDQHMEARKPTADDRRNKRPLYQTHRKTCPERDPADDYKERSPSWVREPEGY